MRLSLAEVAEATGGRLVGAPGWGEGGSARVSTYHTDSREVAEGGLFFALRGAEMDGHSFVVDAVTHGAAAVVVERPLRIACPQVIVGDSWEALYGLARLVLDRVAPLVVGITGSNGKTSTKELAAAVLEAGHRVHRTAGNLNSETGVPLTMLQVEPEHDAVVLELGMREPGEIARLAALARPRVGVVTGIGTVHAEYFGDGRDGIARAKAELVEALPADGLAVLNAADDYFEMLSGLSGAPVVGVTLSPSPAGTTPAPLAGEGRGGRERREIHILRAAGYRPLPDGGAAFSVEGVEVRLGLGGRHQARNALAALAVGRFAGVPLAEGARQLAAVRVPHRLEELPQPGGWTLIDDAYNASPESMLASFETIAERVREGRLLALLGEMRELGPLAEGAHRRVGAAAGKVFDRVAVVDVGWGRLLAETARGELVSDLAAAAAWVREQVRSGDVVLVKASHGVALYEVVKELQEAPA